MGSELFETKAQLKECLKALSAGRRAVKLFDAALDKDTNNLEQRLEYVERCMKNPAAISMIDQPWSEEDLDRMIAGYAKRVDELYALFRVAFPMHREVFKAAEQKADRSNTSEEVWAIADEKMIQLHLPMLGRKLPGYYSNQFVPEVQSAMKNLLADNHLLLTWFLRKTVNYLFVYPGETAYIPDSDNHDTKAVTDAVTGPLGGDVHTDTDFSYATTKRDDVAPGTYIFVMKGRGNYIQEDILDQIGSGYDKPPANKTKSIWQALKKLFASRKMTKE